jgi:hypothetical protein
MRGEDGGFDGLLKPGPRAKAAWRGALDLLFPPQAIDGGPAPLSGGLSPQAWSRIHFLDGPVCDGCGAIFVAERPRSSDSREAGTRRRAGRQRRDASAAAA